MPFSIEVAKTTFAGGEVSPELRVRSDLAKAQTGLWFLENMVVLLEGGIARAPGTQMILPLDGAHAYVLIPFRFAGFGSNAYCVVVGNGVAKFILGAGVVQAPGGGDYTLALPYGEADLGGQGAAAAGVSNLRWAVSGNVVFLFCGLSALGAGQPPQTLTRQADNSWALAPYITAPSVPTPQGGCLAPVDPENLDPLQTIAVSATAGQITLNASPNCGLASSTVPGGFQAGHIGSVWRLDESNLSLIPEWIANQNVVPTTGRLNSANYLGGMANPANAFDGNAATAATETAASDYVGVQLGTAGAVLTAAILCGGGSVSTLTINLRAKNTAPASKSDGVLLASGTISAPVFGGLPWKSTLNLTSNDQLTNYTYVWIEWSTSDAAHQTSIYEADFEGLLATTTPTLYRWNGNVYQALNTGNSGTNPPLHASGAVLSGPGGVEWLYRHRDRGFVLITAVASPTQATATVLERLPDSCLAQPTANWWPSAWDGIKGWPAQVAMVNNSLRVGRQGRFWWTQPGTFNNYDIVDPTSPQSAIAAQLVSPNGSLAWIEWLWHQEFFGAGARDEEWALAGQDPFAAVTIANLNPYPAGKKGSAPHVPAPLDDGLVTISRSRARAYLMRQVFNGVMPKIVPEELTKSARHILRDAGGALGCSRQEDPHGITWLWCKSGLLVGNTMMGEEQICGWHRHPQHAPTQSAVQGIATVPSNDEGVSQTYLQTQRTIGGGVKKFVELQAPFFTPLDPTAPDARGAWFLDCALRYQGPPVQVIGGLNHLIGCAVGVHADGAMYLNPDGSLPLVNAQGQITLSRPTQDAIVGLPKPYRARLLPLDLTGAKGSTAGQKQKANHLFLRVVNAAGGAVAVNPDEGGLPENLEQPGALVYGAAMPLRTDTIRTPGLEVPLAEQTVVELTGALTAAGVQYDTMPFTLIGVDPDVEVVEQD